MTVAADPYRRCPDCGFIAPPESMEYTLTSDDGIDGDRPVHVTCLICHARHDITADDVLQADAEMACKRCGITVAYPAGAVRIRCTGCGLFLLAPGLDETRRGELRISEGLACLALRETYLATKQGAEGPAGGEDPALGHRG